MFELRNHLVMSMLALLVLVPAAGAQTVSQEDQVNLHHPTRTGELGLFTAISGKTLKQGDWSFSVYWDELDYLAAEPLPSMQVPSRRSFREMDIDESRISATIGYGLTDRWEVVVSIPYSAFENNAGDLAGFINGFPRQGKFNDNGFGSLHIGTKFALVDPAGDSQLALSLFGDLGVGDDDSGISSGATDYGAGLHWNSGVWVASGRYKITGDRDAEDNPLGFEVDLADEILLDIGVNLPLRFWGTTNWINEINAIIYNGGDNVGQPDDIVYLVSGIRHWFGTSGWALNAAVRGNITMATSDNNSCPIGGLLGLSYAPMHLTPPPPPPAVVPPPPPPPPAPVTPPPAPVAPPKEPVELRVDEVVFEPESARVTNIAKAILDDVALRMKQEPASTAIVIGYIDSAEAEVESLDRRRAEAVRDYLVSRHGIDPSRITVEARGTDDPAENNRRVVIRLIVP